MATYLLNSLFQFIVYAHDDTIKISYRKYSRAENALLVSDHQSTDHP